MAPARQLQKNIRPQRAQDDYDDILSDAASGSALSAPSASGSVTDDSGSDSMSEPEEQGADGEEFDDEEENVVEPQISNISFGALKQAQDAISRKRKRGSDSTPDQEKKLEALRVRLQQIKDAKASSVSMSKLPREGSTRKARPDATPGFFEGEDDDDDDNDDDDNDDDDDSDSAPSEEGAGDRARSSKHAPTAQSSKYQVSRRRTVIDVPKRQFRDPRFDALQQRSGHRGDSEKAYGFLRDYQKSEIEELKAAMKRTKNEEDREILKRKVGSMENQLKAKEAKERTQEVIRRHRREEREKVEQGKTPYYLKKKEIKERALVEKFKGMKSKDREKLIERRQRKEGQKEKKRMPNVRRMAG